MAKSKNPEKSRAGRPSKWNPAFVKQVEKLALLGATSEEIAEFFEVHIDTIYEWMKLYPKFSEAIKRGKTMADTNVADRLYQKAMGFEHDSEEIKTVSTGNGKSQIVRVPVRKIYPPDTVAAIFWLKNRQRGKWQDRIEQDLTTKGESLNQPMTDQQVDKVIDALKKRK